MPNTCINDSDLIVPAFDASAKTSQVILNIHPGQVRILDDLAASGLLRFVDREDAARFAICYGAHALLIAVPNNYALLEAKMDILQDEKRTALLCPSRNIWLPASWTMHDGS